MDEELSQNQAGRYVAPFIQAHSMERHAGRFAGWTITATGMVAASI